MADMWELDESGGLLTDYTGTVSEAFFGTDSRYADGKSLLFFMKMETDDPNVPVTEERFSVGAGWETMDGGKTIERTDGKDKGIRASSKYGHLIARAVELGMRPVLEPKGGPLVAASWEGVTWKVNQEKIEYGGDLKPANIILPVEYLGEGASSSTSGASAGTPAPATSNGTPEMTDELKTKLAVLAKTNAHSAWVDQALALPGVIEDGTLVSALADEGFYNQMKES